MADEERQLTIIEVFEGSSICKVWHQGEWWLCVPDVMTVFAGTGTNSKRRLDTEES